MSRAPSGRDTVHVKYRKIHTSDLKYDEKFLERGTYGDVRKATWQDKSVAVKMFSCSERKGGFSEELVCLSMLHEHQNIVNLHGAHLGDTRTDRPFLVLEFAPYSLEKVLHQCRRELRYTLDHVMSWTIQMAIALEYIHSQNMLHRDIKPSNILLFQDGSVLKLCDFGTARKLEHTLTNAVGTSWYMAPEVIRGTCYTASCDVYSFGVVLWEMITRHKPYLSGTHGKSLAPQSVLYRVATGGRPPMIARLPKCLEELIQRCWDEGSHKRPTTLEIKTKMERLVKLIQVDLGKPFIHLRCPKAEDTVKKGAESGGVAKISDVPTPHASQHQNQDSQKSTESTPHQSPPSHSSPSSHPPPSTTPSTSPPSSSTPPPPPHSSQSPSHIPPSHSTPALVSTPSRRPHNITPSPISHQAPQEQQRELHATLPALTFTERLYSKQQSSPATESSAQFPEVTEEREGEEPLSSSYPHGKLSPFLERKGQIAPSNQSVQYVSQPLFSPPSVTHQDSNMSEVIEREGEEENVVSQQQRQHWFQQLEKKSKSEEWEASDGPDPMQLYPKAQLGISPFSIPGLEDDWQPVVPDPADGDSMHYYNQYKRAVQQVLETKNKLALLTELRAQLEQEISRDEDRLAKNKSAQHKFQALLNQKDVMVSELQQIKAQLKAKQRNN